MENTIEINEVDLGDNTLTADTTYGSGVAASTECTPIELVVVESESESRFGARAGDESMSVSVSEAGGEGGSAAF